MDHQFTYPRVREIVRKRPVPAPPRPSVLSQRELVEASLWRRPEHRITTAW
jgi:hypothetical protein